MNPPGFWQHGGASLPARLLSPVSALVAAYTARRVSQPGWNAPVPVICVGNVTVGGTGKTTVALDLGQRLLNRGARPHFLTRGYGGSVRGVHRVSQADPATLVGDEALLLAEIAPTWVSPDRAASARAAIAEGAGILIMDDGLQNPTLIKDLSLLVIDGESGFGNGHVLPAGPLREPIEAGAARCQAAILIGPDRTEAAATLPGALPKLRANLLPFPEIAELMGRPVLAVAGIARPDKFFTMLEQAGVNVTERAAFPDHHVFIPEELRQLRAQAAASGLALVTTPKDAVRLPPDIRSDFTVIGVGIAWESEPRIETFYNNLLSA